MNFGLEIEVSISFKPFTIWHKELYKVHLFGIGRETKKIYHLCLVVSTEWISKNTFSCSFFPSFIKKHTLSIPYSTIFVLHFPCYKSWKSEEQLS